MLRTLSGKYVNDGTRWTVLRVLCLVRNVGDGTCFIWKVRTVSVMRVLYLESTLCCVRYLVIPYVELYHYLMVVD